MDAAVKVKFRREEGLPVVGKWWREHEGITGDQFEARAGVGGGRRRVVGVFPAMTTGLRRRPAIARVKVGEGVGALKRRTALEGRDGESVSLGIFVEERGGIGEADSDARMIAKLLDADFGYAFF